ncbi:hypothetical protein QTP88_013190 [Uroleucon formosanum]
MKVTAVRLNHKKEQVIILDEDNMLLDDKMIYTSQPKIYPFAVVLRLRVLQIVCGITGLVMGMVATIEEKGKMNLGLAIPAGILTVIAAVKFICIKKQAGYPVKFVMHCKLVQTNFKYLLLKTTLNAY